MRRSITAAALGGLALAGVLAGTTTASAQQGPAPVTAEQCRTGGGFVHDHRGGVISFGDDSHAGSTCLQGMHDRAHIQDAPAQDEPEA